MFGKSKKPTADSLSYGKVETVVGEGTQIKGSIQSVGVIRIDGFLEGTLEHDGDLIIGPKGRLHAGVRAKALAMAGEIKGNVCVDGKLELLPGALLEGDVRCGNLVIHEGARFVGRSHMGGPEDEPDTAPSARLSEG